MNDNELPAAPVAGDLPTKPNRTPGRLLSSRKGTGGSYNHNPLCNCNPCKARRRQTETLTVAAGERGIRLAPESTPLNPITDHNDKTKQRAAPLTLRNRVGQYLYYKLTYPDLSTKALAEKIGVDAGTLYKVIKDGRESGLLSFDDPLERIEHEIVPKVIDNLNHFLDAKDKTVTIEAAKGTIFSQFRDSKGISEGNQTILALKIEQADGQEVKIMTGHIVGTPKGVPTIIET